MLKVTTNWAPPPLEFGEGDQAFKLHVRPPNTIDRAGVLDAMAGGSFVGIQRMIESLITGWDGVCGPDGSPIPFEGTTPDGATGKMFSRVMGFIPLTLQFEIVAGVLAFVGVPKDNAEAFAKAVEAAVGVRPNADPITPRPSNGPGAASSS